MDDKKMIKNGKGFVDYEKIRMHIKEIIDNHTSEFIEPLKESHSEKLKIIEGDSNMSTQEKLDAINQAENEFLLNIAKFIFVTTTVLTVPKILSNKEVLNGIKKLM